MDSEEALSLLALAEDAEVGLTGAESARWIDNLRTRLGDLRAAATWFLEHGEAERALRLASALTMFWRQAERIDEGRRWIEEVLGGPGAGIPSAARAKALYGAGMLAFIQGDNETSRSRNEEALRLARAADDRRVELLALVGLSRVALHDGQPATVDDLARKARAIARDFRDRRAEARPLHMLAAAARVRGDLEGARALYEESLALNQELDDGYMVAMELLNLGHVERNLGNLDRSEDRFRESLWTGTEGGNTSLVPDCLMGLGATAAARGDLERAARLLAAAEARMEAAGAVFTPDDQPEFDRAVAAVRQGLPPERVEALWAEGRALPPERALHLALKG